MPASFVAAAEGPGVAAELKAHTVGEGPGSRPDQEMEVIREERPGLYDPGAGLHLGPEPGEEVGAIGVTPEDDGPLHPSHPDMVQGTGGIHPRPTRHGTPCDSTRGARRASRTGSPRDGPKMTEAAASPITIPRHEIVHTEDRTSFCQGITISLDERRQYRC